MKLENIQSKLQSSFILLQFVHLSILHYTTIEDGLDRIGVDPDLNRVIEGIVFLMKLGDMEDKTAEGSIEMIIIGAMVTTEVGIDQERGHSQEVIVVIELEV